MRTNNNRYCRWSYKFIWRYSTVYWLNDYDRKCLQYNFRGLYRLDGCIGSSWMRVRCCRRNPLTRYHSKNILFGWYTIKNWQTRLFIMSFMHSSLLSLLHSRNSIQTRMQQIRMFYVGRKGEISLDAFRYESVWIFIDSNMWKINRSFSYPLLLLVADKRILSHFLRYLLRAQNPVYSVRKGIRVFSSVFKPFFTNTSDYFIPVSI